MKYSIAKPYQLCVIGASAGGFAAINDLISNYPLNFIPVIIVLHQAENSTSMLAELLQSKTKNRVKEAEADEAIEFGIIYIAPPAYHTQVEADKTISLSKELPVNFSRPSIDVLFESAAIAYQCLTIGIILTGANDDGTKGLKLIKQKGGLTIAQDPKTAEVATMPQSAVDKVQPDKILTLPAISEFLQNLSQQKLVN